MIRCHSENVSSFLPYKALPMNISRHNEMRLSAWAAARTTYTLAKREHITDDNGKSGLGRGESQSGDSRSWAEIAASEALRNHLSHTYHPHRQPQERGDVVVVQYDEWMRQPFIVDSMG